MNSDIIVRYENAEVTAVIDFNASLNAYSCKMSDGTTKHVPKEVFVNAGIQDPLADSGTGTQTGATASAQGAVPAEKAVEKTEVTFRSVEEAREYFLQNASVPEDVKLFVEHDEDRKEISTFPEAEAFFPKDLPEAKTVEEAEEYYSNEGAKGSPLFCVDGDRSCEVDSLEAAKEFFANA